MLRTEIDAVLVEVLAGRRLLDHPFYRRWEAGDLEVGELAAYAGQYRHVEAALPGVLERALAGIEDPEARRPVQANLDDERSKPAPHVELFEGFAAAVGAPARAEATPATEALLAVTGGSATPAAALAALAAYEVQAAAIATSKAAGLRRHYGIDDTGTRFWDVHAGLEADHGGWTVEAIAALGAQRPEVEGAAAAAA
ncbi:MAG TPA: iron-containing redox enzyme family protein, partial [Acidimicrobiales bacterium]|nr:iron-containing redox enzyme family protein [Acidimicrobiales bacterium]